MLLLLFFLYAELCETGLGVTTPCERDTLLVLVCVQLSAKAIFGELSYVCQSQGSWECYPTASL